MITFDDFIGQDPIKEELKKAAGHHVHILLRGPSGWGKTMLAEITASMRGSYDLVGAMDFDLSSLNSSAVTHIVDEVHRLVNPEQLYDVMTIVPFIFCTTDTAELRETLTNRCISLTLQPYQKVELMLIGHRKYEVLDPSVLTLLASRSRGTPRTMLQLCERVTINVEDVKDYFAVKSFLDKVGVLNGGYTVNDHLYLENLKLLGRASAQTMASVLRVPLLTVTNEIEPFLLREKKIAITSRGRVIR